MGHAFNRAHVARTEMVYGLAIALVVAAYTPEQIRAGNKVLTFAQDAVREQVNDPESTRFRSLAIYSDEGGDKRVCGEFNTKNRLGGYVGFQTFYVDLPSGSLHVQQNAGIRGEMDAESWGLVVARNCAEVLYRPAKP